jgi:hypothetical protein
VTARTPYPAGGGDVSSTLGDLERKLRELERELSGTAARSAPAPAPVAPTPPAPSYTTPSAVQDADLLIAQARARLGSLDGQVDELLRFREQLHRTARELEEEYSRVLARIGAPPVAPGAFALPTAPVAAPAPAMPAPQPLQPLRGPLGAGLEAELLPNHPAFTQPDQHLAPPAVEGPPAYPAAPAAPVHQAPAPVVPLTAPPAPGPVVTPYVPAAVAPTLVAAPAPVAPAPAPVTPSVPPTVSAHEDAMYEGAITLDAGPFTDIAALSTFEQALAHVPGAEDVYVSGFTGNRALVELRLSRPAALVREMRAVLPAAFTVTDAAANRLRLDVSAIQGA